jgi:hypothetical protein
MGVSGAIPVVFHLRSHAAITDSRRSDFAAGFLTTAERRESNGLKWMVIAFRTPGDIAVNRMTARASGRRKNAAARSSSSGHQQM